MKNLAVEPTSDSVHILDRVAFSCSLIGISAFRNVYQRFCGGYPHIREVYPRFFEYIRAFQQDIRETGLNAYELYR